MNQNEEAELPLSVSDLEPEPWLDPRRDLDRVLVLQRDGETNPAKMIESKFGEDFLKT